MKSTYEATPAARFKKLYRLSLTVSDYTVIKIFKKYLYI